MARHLWPTRSRRPSAARSISLLEEGPWQQRVGRIEAQLREELDVYADHPAVKDVRVLGAIGVVECHDPVSVAAAQERFIDAGVWIRPFGSLIYLMPPYIMDTDDLTCLTAAVELAFGLEG